MALLSNKSEASRRQEGDLAAQVEQLRAQVEQLAERVELLSNPETFAKVHATALGKARNDAYYADAERRRDAERQREEDRKRELPEILRRFDERIARGDLPSIAGFGEPVRVLPWQKRGSKGYTGVPRERWAEWAKRRGEPVHAWGDD